MYRKNRRLKDILRHSRKTLVMMMAMVIAFSGAIGGTLAWLMDKTQTITNTFTVGDINIELDETGATDIDNDGDEENSYEITPGGSVEKDPWVTVKAGSKACWLFVKLDKSANFDTYLSYTVDTSEGAWTALEGESGVYYRMVSASAADQKFYVIKDNKVSVKNVSMDALINGTESLPTLSVTAYAVQQANIASAAEAWKQVAPAAKTISEPALTAEKVVEVAEGEKLTKEQEEKLAWGEFVKSGE